jgi:hypothetical protein
MRHYTSDENEQKQKERIDEFYKTYRHGYYHTVVAILRWSPYLFREKKTLSREELYSGYIEGISLVDKEPMKLEKYNRWTNTGESEFAVKCTASIIALAAISVINPFTILLVYTPSYQSTKGKSFRAGASFINLIPIEFFLASRQTIFPKTER